MKKEEIKEESEVKILKHAVILQKPSGTIAIAGNLNTLQRKFYNIFLHEVKNTLQQNINTERFEITLDTLKKFLNVKERDKNNAYFRQVIDELFKTVVEYNMLGKDKVIYGKAHLLDNLDWQIDKKTHNVVIKYTIPLIIKNAMVNILKGKPDALYANIDLVIIKGLKSKYSVLLYELCKDYEKAEVPEMSIQEMRKIFGIENKRTYRIFTNVRMKILDPAIQELNTNPNIPFYVKYQLVKEGNTYTRIKFIVTPKPVKLTQQTSESEGLQELLLAIPEEYRKAKNCASLLLEALKEKDKEYIKAQIEYVNSKKPENYVAYLREAIENDYAGFEIKKKEEEKRKQVQIRQLEKEKQEYVEEVIIREKDKIYQEFIEEVKTEEEKQEVFRKYLPEVYEKYPVLKGCNLNDPRVKLALRGIIVEDIIKENKILQERLEKIKEKAEKEAEEIHKMKLKEIESYLF